MRKTKSAGDKIVTMDRRSTKERRAEPKAKPVEAQPASKKSPEPARPEANNKRFQSDRRSKDFVPDNMAKLIAQEKRKVKVQRRRQIDPTTCERDYSNDEIAFMQAMDEYKRKNGRMFPTCSEILEVVRAIGYVKVDASQPPAEQPADD